MSIQFNRRLFVTAGIGVAGSIVGLKAGQSQSFRTGLPRTRIQSVARVPLSIAMLDRHAVKMAPLLPEIESALNRRLTIEALAAEDLYANFTIDLLQQTGRYDVVSLNDAWIPYFGRRGYLTAVPDLEEAAIPGFPVRIQQSARGVDGTELVAYPWTFDFTCAAVNRKLGWENWSRDWGACFRAIQSDPDVRLAVALQPSASAAETYRAVLLTFGEDLIADDTNLPTLGTYAARRALETTVRLARIGNAAESLTRSLTMLPGLAASDVIDIVPALWASDSASLWLAQDWDIDLLPTGRPGRGATSATFWMWGIPAGAPNVDAARMFVQWVLGQDIQSRLWQTAGLLPATRPAINTPLQPGGDALKRLTLRALDRSRFRPQLRSFRSLMGIAGQLVADSVTNSDEGDRLRIAANEAMRTVLIQEGELEV